MADQTWRSPSIISYCPVHLLIGLKGAPLSRVLQVPDQRAPQYRLKFHRMKRQTKKTETLTAETFIFMTKQILKTNSLYCRNRGLLRSQGYWNLCFCFALLNILYKVTKTVLKQNKEAAERHTAALKEASSAGCSLNLVREGVVELVFQ